MEPIRLLVVDDHSIIRQGIQAMVRHRSDILIAGEVGTGREALELLEKDQVDVVLMDIDMPGLSGIEVTKIINQKYPKIEVLALTLHEESSFITAMLKAGASGYLLKNSNSETLVEAIHTIHRGESYLPPQVSNAVLHNMMKKKPASYKSPVNLTTRELEVLKLISEGYNNSQIAEMLFISKRTVDTHRHNLLEKLNLNNTAGLVRYAFEHNLA